MDKRITILEAKNSLLNPIMFELRDENVQQDRLRFRTNMEKVGEILAYEMSQYFPYQTQNVKTVLGELEMRLFAREPVLVSILRAGMPLHNGFLRMLDRADNGFISAYRRHTKGNEFIIKIEYSAIPEIEDREVILIDPMIATGRSIVLAAKEIFNLGQPRQLYLAGAVASEDGLSYVSRNLPMAKIFVAAVDQELTAKSYIVPGLGDAGDLAFGPK
ncbi:MAG: uracil phosphoribosyltransferase [Bacteroidota bacterium]